jgi:hypothetical protein
MVVKHEHIPTEQTKMDNQVQTTYNRKNWSSVILWNLEHPAHKRLSLEMVNELPGRDLHRFCWLEDGEIGDLPLAWNYLVGVDPDSEVDLGIKPKLLHYTLGTPELGIKGSYAREWLSEREIMDASRAYR